MVWGSRDQPHPAVLPWPPHLCTPLRSVPPSATHRTLVSIRTIICSCPSRTEEGRWEIQRPKLTYRRRWTGPRSGSRSTIVMCCSRRSNPPAASNCEMRRTRCDRPIHWRCLFLCNCRSKTSDHEKRLSTMREEEDETDDNSRPLSQQRKTQV